VPSASSSSSSSPLDAQIAHLKEDEALDGRRNREKAREAELPLAFEDGDEPMNQMEFFRHAFFFSAKKTFSIY
jgi:hypothetical protein